MKKKAFHHETYNSSVLGSPSQNQIFETAQPDAQNYKFHDSKLITFAILLLALSFTFAHATVPTGYHIDKNFNVIPNDPKANKKVVLLTIDDGPTIRSNDILKILTKENIKVIFFINGINVKNNPNVLKNEIKAGNAIGNHTWDHKNLKKLKDAQVQKEIDQNTALIKKETGIASHFFRPPDGITGTFAKAYVQKNGMIIMNWSDAAIDWDKSAHDKKVFIANVMKGLHPGAVILMHEHPWSLSALPDLITTLKSKGYTFVDPKDITN